MFLSGSLIILFLIVPVPGTGPGPGPGTGPGTVNCESVETTLANTKSSLAINFHSGLETKTETESTQESEFNSTQVPTTTATSVPLIDEAEGSPVPVQPVAVTVTGSRNHIKFILYTQENPEEGSELVIGIGGMLKNSNYVPMAPLKIILHGFSKSALGGHGPRLKSAYLDGNRSVNVVLVDWTDLAKKPRYDKAALNSKLVGETTGQLIMFLVDEAVLDLAHVHLIGHSLGAHAAGYAGRYVGAGRIGRITALDPAAPLFTEVGNSQTVDQSDAAFVDVIHTGASILGLKEPLGHVDFYPNGGSNQPGCKFDWIGTCDHKRANYYMLESINNPESFEAWECGSWSSFTRGNCYNNQVTHMGEHVSKSSTVSYYLRTNSKEPFSL